MPGASVASQGAPVPQRWEGVAAGGPWPAGHRGHPPAAGGGGLGGGGGGEDVWGPGPAQIPMVSGS